VPVVQALTAGDAEESHKFAVKALSKGLAPKDLGKDDESLAFQVYCASEWTCVGCCVHPFFLSATCISSGIDTFRTRSVWPLGSIRTLKQSTLCSVLALAMSKSAA
jgi:hypothetical protein